jgi:hypothetical protein
MEGADVFSQALCTVLIYLQSISAVQCLHYFYLLDFLKPQGEPKILEFTANMQRERKNK